DQRASPGTDTALDGVDVGALGFAELAQVVGDDAERSGHADGGVPQRVAERPDAIVRELDGPIDHDDHISGGAAQPRILSEGPAGVGGDVDEVLTRVPV